MCIDVEFVKGLLVHMIDKLDNAKLLVKEDKPVAVIEHQLGEAMKTFELLRIHMDGVYTDEDQINWDALVHSVL